MESKDKQKFVETMAALQEVFDGDRPFTEMKAEIYFKALERFPMEDIESAAHQMIQKRIYPSLPKPAEIIQEMRGAVGDQATLAWIKVDGAVRRVGAYASVKFDDLIIHSVIEIMGGWEELSKTSQDEWKWKQKEFEKLYQAVKHKKVHPEYLPGIDEVYNSTRGFGEYIKPPVQIFADRAGSIRIHGGRKLAVVRRTTNGS